MKQPPVKKKLSKTRRILPWLSWIPAVYFLFFWLWPYIYTPKLQLTPDTVYIDNPPINKYGTVDYMGWLNEKSSKGVTPDENIITGFAKIFGANKFTVHQLKPKAVELLQMDDIPDKGIYISLEDYQKLHKIQDTYKMDFLLDGEQYLWTPEESPQTAAYLETNRPALDAAIIASNRKFYYRPLMSKKDTLLESDTIAIGLIRNLSEALVCRSNMLMAQGKLEEAWRDIMAIRKIGLLMQTTAERPITLIDQLVGLAIRTMADRQAMTMLAQENLTKEQCNEFFKQWNQLTYQPYDLTAIMTAMRIEQLDMAMSLYDERGKGHTNIDINSILREINQKYNHATDIIKSYPLREMDKELEATFGKMQELQISDFYKTLFLSSNSRNFTSKIICNTIASLMLTEFGNILILYEAEHSRYDLAKLGLALRCYNFKYGKYPEKLLELSPEFLKEIPADPLADGPYHYKRTDNGFSLYGVGKDGIDDGGKKIMPGKSYYRGTDIVIEVPFKNPPLPKKKTKPKRRPRPRRQKTPTTLPATTQPVTNE